MFITDINQGEYPLVVAFEINSIFDGDSVHKCTSIHLRTNIEAYLSNLNDTTVFVKNKNELNALCREVNILDRLQRNNKLINVNLSQNNNNVKYQSRTSDLDNKYLNAVNSGDIETAQKLVDEVAKENGYTIKAYHGTTNRQEKSIIKLYVEEYYNDWNNKIQRRNYDAKKIETFNDTDRFGENISAPLYASKNVSMNNISDLFSFVKQYDKEFNPKPVNPLVLNEDGTPKVFYHSTNESFTVFKKGERAGLSGKGIYFSPYQQNFYGRNSMSVYLKIKNPRK